jgi:6-phosphogluconolactonase
VSASVEILDGPAEVAHAAAERFVAAAEASLRARGRFAVALAGGSTPRATYALLARPPLSGRVDWARVEIFFGDERCVPPDHDDSNYRMANEALLRHVPLDPARVHRIAGERAPDEAAAAYAAVLQPLDLVLLGMGPDGHTASLFPGTTALDERERPVVAVWVDKLHAWRVTLTAPVLSAAAHVVVCAVGAEKADALKLALESPPGAVPIQLVQPRELTWLIDRAAAAKLAR